AQARSAARYNLAFFAQLPFYRKQWRRCGFVDEVNALQETWKRNDRRAAAALVSDRMVDEVCVFGPPSLCREQLAAFHVAGAAMPVIAVSPVNEERLVATRKALSLLAPKNGRDEYDIRPYRLFSANKVETDQFQIFAMQRANRCGPCVVNGR